MKKIILIIYLLFFVGQLISQQNYFDGLREYKTGDLNKCIVLFTKSIDERKNISESYMYRGAANVYIGKYKEAEKDLFISLNLDSINHKVYFYLGMLKIKTNNNLIAIHYLSKSIEINNKAPKTYDYRALAKSNLLDYKGAIEDEDIAIKIDSLNGRWYSNRGVHYLKIGLYEKAISDFNRTIFLDSVNYPKAYSNKGLALSLLNFHNKAIKQYNIAILMMPIAKDVIHLRGISYFELGNTQKACKDFKKSKDLGFYGASIKYKLYCE